MLKKLTDEKEIETLKKMVSDANVLVMKIADVSDEWFKKAYPKETNNGNFCTSLFLQAYMTCLSRTLAFAMNDIGSINPAHAEEFFGIFKAKLENETRIALDELFASKKAMTEKAGQTIN